MALDQEGSGKIDVENWLKQNKLGEFCELFKSKDITIEEITDWNDDDLSNFAKETLNLDTLSQKRFLRAVQKIRPQNTSIMDRSLNIKRRIIISGEEQESLSKLYQRFDECSKQQIEIQKALNVSNENSLNQYNINCINNINIIFDDIIKKLINRKDELLQQIDDINNNKQLLLKQQLTVLENEYIPFIQNGKKEYELYTKTGNKNMNILQMISNILTFNNKPIATTVMVTKPNIMFDIDNTLQIGDIFMNKLKIDDCDKPLPPKIKIVKVDADSINIQYDIKKKYYQNIGKSISKICIQYALIKNDEELWSDYKQEYETENDSESEDSDSDSNDDTDLSESDSDNDTDSNDSDNSNNDDTSDDEDGFISTKLKKKRKKKKKKRKKKKKKKAKYKKPKAKIRLIDIDMIEYYDGLKWMEEEYKISSKNKKHDKKFKIREKIKSDKTYLIRMKLLNESGWSEYSMKLYIVKTPKFIINSVILKNKEKIQLKKMVNKQTNRKFKEWKLIYRASKHGIGSTQFITRCDNKKNIIVVIHTQNNNVFGGFTSSGWKGTGTSSCQYSNDNKAFIYLIRSSANYKQCILNVVKPHQAMRTQNGYYCMFGPGPVIHISNSNNVIVTKPNAFAQFANNGNCLAGGVGSTNLNDIEVFQLRK